MSPLLKIAQSKKVGVKIPLESERGYHIEYHEPNIELKSSLMICEGKFVMNSMLGRLRCAGLVEFGGLAMPPSAQPFKLIEKKQPIILGLTIDL